MQQTITEAELGSTWVTYSFKVNGKASFYYKVCIITLGSRLHIKNSFGIEGNLEGEK